MFTLLELWNDLLVAKPFIAIDDAGNYFLCQSKINGDYFLGLRIEIDPFDPRVFRSVKTIVCPGNLSVWTLI